jgi:hypothetical protein
MAEIGLQCSGIDTLVGQCVAAGMPEHVWMNLEPNLGFVAGAGEQLAKGEADWRFSSRSARNSSPKRGCVASWPPLARRTCIVPV